MSFRERIRVAAQLAVLALAAGICGCDGPARPPAESGGKGPEIVALVTIEGLGRSWSRLAPADAGPTLRALADPDGAPVFTPCPSLVPAIASLMTGVPPSSHGVLDNFGSRVPASVPLLAEELKAAGLRTGAFVANPLLARITALDRGFEVFDGSAANVLATSRFFPEVRRADRVVGNAATWIRSLRGADRAFLWVDLSELGELNLESVSGPPPGLPERLNAVDRAVGSLRDVLRSAGNRGVLFVVGDRGQMAASEGDLGQGFFLDPDAVGVYFAEEAFGGGSPISGRRPLLLSDLHRRILGAAGGQPKTPEPAATGTENSPVVVSSSSIPWNWCRWPAAVAVQHRGVLWIRDGQWRRSDDLQVATACPETDVPEEVQRIAREETERLQTDPPPGPRAQELRASIQKFGLKLGTLAPGARPPALSERRRIVALLQRARLLAAFRQLGPASEALAPLRSDPNPLPAALMDSLMFAAIDPNSNGREWELGARTLARLGALPPALHWTAHAALRRRNSELTELLLQAFLETVPADADALYDLACIRSLSGDIAGAEAMLRAAADAGFQAWDYVEVDEDLRNFRADPRYAAFRKSLGR